MPPDNLGLAIDQIEDMGTIDLVGYLDLPRSYPHGLVITLFHGPESLEAKSVIYLASDRKKVEELHIEGQPIGDTNLPATLDLDGAVKFYGKVLDRKKVPHSEEELPFESEDGKAYLQTYPDTSPEMIEKINETLAFLRQCYFFEN